MNMINPNIKVLPSTLLEDTILERTDRAADLSKWWVKDPGDSWSTIRTWRDDYILPEKADEILRSFKIASVPPAFYGEFRSVPQGGPYEVNRAGWLRYKDMVFFDRVNVTYGNFEQTIEEAVRRAFA